jgi:hypothetical protein
VIERLDSNRAVNQQARRQAERCRRLPMQRETLGG